MPPKNYSIHITNELVKWFNEPQFSQKKMKEWKWPSLITPLNVMRKNDPFGFYRCEIFELTKM